jgi:hypothetical protein
MPDDKQVSTQEDIFKSQVALHALRDYVYQQRPVKLLATDFVEDIPSLRPYGSVLSNVLPSAAIISNNPAERKKQVAEAVRRVTQASKKEHPLAKEVLTSSAKFGLGSIPLSILFGLVEKSFHIPGHGLNPFKRGMPKFILNKQFEKPYRKQKLVNHLKNSVGTGILQGAIFGATPPLISKYTPIDRKHIIAASKLLNEHPQLTALPNTSYAALSNQEKPKESNPIKDHIENIGVGAGMGLAAALGGQAAKSGVRATANLPHAILNKPINFIEKHYKDDPIVMKHMKDLSSYKKPAYNMKEIFRPLSWKSLRGPLATLPLMAAGLSGLSSAITHPSVKNE